ncbi:citrate lyase acyl carrier protein [bacterium]|nr:citrate lyase acyl carrier protein [bacterium]
MKIIKKAQCGSLESSDLMIYIEPSDGVKIEVESSISQLHNKEIEYLVIEELKARNIDKVYIKIHDSGAMNLTIKARLKTVLNRGIKNEDQA